ncbi:NAD(P)H-binding protein [Kribbella sp. NPDC049584]|uniref:NAD(P)H-binding protein n=1 Tax=Kribbella sp. NPDC049584 TaxID=3154833 RepID=UPI00344AB124
MRILVWGAAGAVGGRVTQEAVARGHQVTAVGRSGPVRGDAADPEDVARLSAGHDVVISATRPRPGQRARRCCQGTADRTAWERHPADPGRRCSQSDCAGDRSAVGRLT